MILNEVPSVDHQLVRGVERKFLEENASQIAGNDVSLGL